MRMKSVFNRWPRGAVLLASVGLVSLVGACGADPDATLPACDEALCTVDDDAGDGIRTTVVHAPDEDAPVFFRFSAPDAAVSADEVAAGAWDLSFARTTIRANGGASGEGGVEVAWRHELGIDDADEAPTDGWVSDGEGEDDLAFARSDGWYSYDILKHVVEPRDRLYFVRAGDGSVYALEMISYYDHRGESRAPTFSWRLLATP